MMDKYQKAIFEYDAARKQIIEIGRDISDSIGVYVGDIYRKKCTCGNKSENPFDDTDCVPLLYKWNMDSREYDRWKNRTHYYEEDFEPDGPESEEPPELCEAGKLTDKLIQERKAAKKRFGIAKRRLSALAKGLTKTDV